MVAAGGYRELSQRPWGRIAELLSYKAATKEVDPRGALRTCPGRGSTDAERRGGTLARRSCKPKIDA